jgi:putative redox protein
MKSSQTRLVWGGDGLFVGIDNGKHSVVISTQGEDAVGMKPSDLLLVSLASCTAVDVTGILRKKRQGVDGLEIVADGVGRRRRGRSGKSILTYKVRGHNIDPAAVARPSSWPRSYCSVSASLKPQVEITWS